MRKKSKKVNKKIKINVSKSKLKANKNLILVSALLIILVVVFAPRLVDLTGRQVFDTTKDNANLVAYYKFDGNMDDETINGNDGICPAAPLPDSNAYCPTLVQGISGQAYEFDGVDDYVELANGANFDFEYTVPFSISMWIKPDGTNSGNLFFKYSHATDSGYIYSTGSDIRFYIRSSENKEIYTRHDKTETPIILNEWNHIVVTYDGSGQVDGVSVYIDSTLQEIISVSGGTIDSGSILNNALPRIGYVNEDMPSFNGAIDEVRVYNSELTADDVLDIFEAEGGVTECIDDDGFCPAGCDFTTDNDCPVECIDTGGGNEYYLQGTANGPARLIIDGVAQDGPIQFHTDTCNFKEPTKVNEWYCGSDGRLTGQKSPPCPNGCQDGACICDEDNTATNDDCPTGYTCVSGACELGALPPTPPTPTLIAHYKFDGNMDDETINGNDGICPAAPLPDSNAYCPTLVQGISGQAYEFDGVDDYVELANEANFDFEYTAPFSISMWIKPYEFGSTLFLFSKFLDVSPPYGYILQTDGTRIRMVMLPNERNQRIVVYSPGNSIILDEWQHIIMTYDGNGANGVSIYIDSILQSKYIGDNTITSGSIQNSVSPKIGGENGFIGAIDEIRVYSGELTADDVQDIFEAAGVTIAGLTCTTEERLDLDDDGTDDHYCDPDESTDPQQLKEDLSTCDADYKCESYICGPGGVCLNRGSVTQVYCAAKNLLNEEDPADPDWRKYCLPA